MKQAGAGPLHWLKKRQALHDHGSTESRAGGARCRCSTTSRRSATALRSSRSPERQFHGEIAGNPCLPAAADVPHCPGAAEDVPRHGPRAMTDSGRRSHRRAVRPDDAVRGGPHPDAVSPLARPTRKGRHRRPAAGLLLARVSAASRSGSTSPRRTPTAHPSTSVMPLIFVGKDETDSERRPRPCRHVDRDRREVVTAYETGHLAADQRQAARDRAAAGSGSWRSPGEQRARTTPAFAVADADLRRRGAGHRRSSTQLTWRRRRFFPVVRKAQILMPSLQRIAREHRRRRASSIQRLYLREGFSASNGGRGVPRRQIRPSRAKLGRQSRSQGDRSGGLITPDMSAQRAVAHHRACLGKSRHRAAGGSQPHGMVRRPSPRRSSSACSRSRDILDGRRVRRA